MPAPLGGQELPLFDATMGQVVVGTQDDGEMQSAGMPPVLIEVSGQLTLVPWEYVYATFPLTPAIISARIQAKRLSALNQGRMASAADSASSTNQDVIAGTSNPQVSGPWGSPGGGGTDPTPDGLTGPEDRTIF